MDPDHVWGGVLAWSSELRDGYWENSMIFQLLDIPSASAAGWAWTQGDDFVGILGLQIDSAPIPAHPAFPEEDLNHGFAFGLSLRTWCTSSIS